MSPAALPLRDVHLPPEPSWWPPAPGWWLVAVACLLVLAWPIAWRAWRLRRRRRWQRMFASACEGLAAPAQLAAMSDLLRRAARRASPGSERLQGEAWLVFLDGKHTAFSQGDGRLLLDGAFRPEVDAAACARVQALAQARFIALMERR